MAMTRKQLKELGLEPKTIESLIQMHSETVDGLRAERDAWQEAAQASEELKLERDRLLEHSAALENERNQILAANEELIRSKEQFEADRRQKDRDDALASALLKEGANPQVIPLLLRAAEPLDSNAPGDENLDAQALVAPLKEQYGAFFCPPRMLCTEVISPPSSSSLVMTREALLAMDTEEINRNWDAVKTALQEVNL